MLIYCVLNLMNYDSTKILNVFLYKFEIKMFYVNIIR